MPVGGCFEQECKESIFSFDTISESLLEFKDDFRKWLDNVQDFLPELLSYKIGACTIENLKTGFVDIFISYKKFARIPIKICGVNIISLESIKGNNNLEFRKIAQEIEKLPVKSRERFALARINYLENSFQIVFSDLIVVPILLDDEENDYFDGNVEEIIKEINGLTSDDEKRTFYSNEERKYEILKEIKYLDNKMEQTTDEICRTTIKERIEILKTELQVEEMKLDEDEWV
jgi:hypothetical protein